MTSDTPNTVTGTGVGGDTKREPWFLSNDNDAEEWRVADGVENFPLEIASQTELGLAIKGTIERAVSAVRAERDEARADREAYAEKRAYGYHEDACVYKQRIEKALTEYEIGSGEYGERDLAGAMRAALTATETSEQ